MIKIVLSIFSVILISPWLCGQNSSLQVYQYQGGEVDFVEIYLRVDAGDMDWKEDNNVLSVETEALLLVRHIGGDTVFAQKYRLAAENFESKADLLDMKRVALSTGGYEAILKLNHDDNIYINSFLLKATIDKVKQSSLLLATGRAGCEPSNQCRIGVQHEPLPKQISGQEDNILYFYNEIYFDSAPIDNQFYICYGIRDEQDEDILKRYKKYDIDKSVPVLTSLDVSMLNSGAYTGFVEVYDLEKSLLTSQSIPFIKVNLKADIALLEEESADAFAWIDTLDEQELVFDLKSIWPLLPFTQAATYDEIIKSDDPRLQRRYIERYWKTNGGDNPYDAYSAYKKVAKAVHLRFYNTVGYGFETDRGYLFLKYGKPNDMIAVEDEPEAPPYQIWRYNYINRTQQSNVKFIFYNPSLVSNDFQLLHSTCRGELQNPAWEVELYRRAPWDQQGTSIEATSVSGGYNRQAKRLFEDL